MGVTEEELLEWVKDYCNNQFLNSDGVEVIPSGVKMFIPKAYEYLQNKAGVASRSMGSVSYSYEMDFPPGLLRLIRPYRKVKFR